MAKLLTPLLFLPLCLAAEAPWQSQGVLYLDASPHAKLHSVPIHAVKMGEGFWSSRVRVNIERSIPSLLQLLEEHGVVDNFRRLSGRKNVARKGPLYTDSDLYKWMEAVGFVLQSGDRPELRATLDRLVDEVLAAQEPSGYLNTYWVEDRAKLRFTEMQRGHELYCLGHLLQAGIAYYRATGNHRLLDAGAKFADYLAENFGPRKRPLLTGHPELELALVELYRTTGKRHYLDLAGYLLSGVERERLGLSDSQVRYMFSGEPFTSRRQLEGHAVRAMYAASGATDYLAETGDSAYWRTLETLWRDMTARKMYITGGVGSRSQGEAFGDPYELPNSQAYTESCAAIGNFFWNYRMLAVTGEARFADVMERALYNGINSGMSLSGTLYCYRNPLASHGEKIRNPWYSTTCCPPNLERVLASLPGYLYSTSPEGVYVHFYHSSEMDWHLEDGTALKLSQWTSYPYGATAAVTVQPAKPAEFILFLRVPGWSENTSVTVNETPVANAIRAGEYLPIRRVWKKGDRVRLNFDLRTKVITANPLVAEDAGKVAVQRGPLIWCLEQLDQPSLQSLFDVSLVLEASDPSKSFTPEFRNDLLGGIWTLRHRGTIPETPFAREPLYAVLHSSVARPNREIQLTLIPYYAWANREPSPMVVWIPYQWKSD
jgi:DUF1680 family protein